MIRTKHSFTKIWFDYENKTSVNKMKKNETNITATTYFQYKICRLVGISGWDIPELVQLNFATLY